MQIDVKYQIFFMKNDSNTLHLITQISEENFYMMSDNLDHWHEFAVKSHLQKIGFSGSGFETNFFDINYRTRAIITRGLHIFYPIFSAVYNQERLILQTI